MSTRSFISIEEGSGFRGIYCHYDGYPGHVGELLVEYHNSFAAAEAIVRGPQIRNLDSDGLVVRFGDGTPDDSEVHESIREALSGGYDYAYVYSTNDNRWKCFERDRYYNDLIVECQIPGNPDLEDV